MAQREHVGIDVFELLLSSGMSLDCAKRLLPADQLDEVDINNY